MNLCCKTYSLQGAQGTPLQTQSVFTILTTAIPNWIFDEPSTLMSICGMLLITTAGIGATIITKRAEARGIAPVEGKVAAEGSKE